MKNKSKKNILIAAVVACITTMSSVPAHAYLWFTIDLTQIPSIISNVSNGISKSIAAVSQNSNLLQTIQSIGDQVSVVAKYAKEIKGTIPKIQSEVFKTIVAVKDTTSDVEDVLKILSLEKENTAKEEKQVVDSAVSATEKMIDAGVTEDSVQDNLNQTKETLTEINTELLNSLQKSKETITDSTTKSKGQMADLQKSVDEVKDLDEPVKKGIEKNISTLDNQIKDVAVQAEEVIEAEHTAQTESLSQKLDSLSNYGRDVSKYFEGSINRADLSASGQKLKEDIHSKQLSPDSLSFTPIKEKILKINDDANILQERILDDIANDKDYIEDLPQLEKDSWLHQPQNFQLSFNKHTETSHIYLKGYYANGDDEDGSFLIPDELIGARATQNPSDHCSQLSFDDLGADKDVNKFIDNLRDCIVHAKTEKEYFCPNEMDLNKCEPFAIEPKFAAYKDEGVYKHLLEDYSIANINNISKSKQYASSWLNLEMDNSTLKVLTDQLEDSKVNRIVDAYALLGLIDLEATTLWSNIRRIDALQRSKDIINTFHQQEALYLDGRDSDFAAAQNSAPGIVEENNVMSNVILYKCGLNGKDISLAPQDKDDEAKVIQAEENIKKCLLLYAEGADRGTTDGRLQGYSSEEKARDAWRINKSRALMDSLYNTFALSVINNYKSSLDYKDMNSDEGTNPVTLQEDQRDVQTARLNYAAGAHINHYTTKQLLSIIDADAQQLQSDILLDLRTINYDFFGDMSKQGGN